MRRDVLSSAWLSWPYIVGNGLAPIESPCKNVILHWWAVYTESSCLLFSMDRPLSLKSNPLNPALPLTWPDPLRGPTSYLTQPYPKPGPALTKPYRIPNPTPNPTLPLNQILPPNQILPLNPIQSSPKANSIFSLNLF